MGRSLVIWVSCQGVSLMEWNEQDGSFLSVEYFHLGFLRIWICIDLSFLQFFEDFLAIRFRGEANLVLLLGKMDFSQFNGPEQAHMTKMIEKKQVISIIPYYHISLPGPSTDSRWRCRVCMVDPRYWWNTIRCKISWDYIHRWWNDVLMLVPKISQAKHYPQTRWVRSSPPRSLFGDSIYISHPALSSKTQMRRPR